MGQATSIRNRVRSFIEASGRSASRYSFSSATKTETEEGDISVTDWGSATTIKLLNSNNLKYGKLSRLLGIDSNTSDRVIMIKDNATVEERDRIIIGSDTYEVREIRRIDPTEGVLLAQRIVLIKNVNY